MANDTKKYQRAKYKNNWSYINLVKKGCSLKSNKYF
jgi:hypothetical protein